MIRIIRYTAKMKTEWDTFCKNSINGVFLFYRDYMDYHSDRFQDHSLLFYKGKKLIALLPCNEKTEKHDNSAEMTKILSSHDGLTFGSFIMGTHTHQSDMMDCVDALKEYCKAEEISEVRFKPVPLLLQSTPAEQDVFALIYHGAKLLKSEPSIITEINGYVPNYGEKWSCRCATQSKLSFKCGVEDSDWKQYHQLLSYVLDKYHQTTPVHSLSELLLLRNRFPENIRLFGVFDESAMVAGTVVYLYNDTVHTQYMAANEEGREKRALHFCIQKLVEYYKKDKDWLDFGTSMLNRGTELDKGLIMFKEGFKGNTVLYNKWSLMI